VASPAQGIVEAEVRELVRLRGIDPIAEPATVAHLVDEVINDYRDRTITSALPPLDDAAGTARLVLDAVAGFGPLQPLLDDPTVEEIWINEPARVFVARDGRSELTTLILQADEVGDLVERMLRPTGRRIDLSTPFVDAMLPDGSRLHVVIPNITRRHMAVNTASQYTRVGGMLPVCARLTQAAVRVLACTHASLWTARARASALNDKRTTVANLRGDVASMS
jgi:pilus assembly protein CpaF